MLPYFFLYIKEFLNRAYAAVEGPAMGGLRSNGAGRVPRNPARAVTKGMFGRISQAFYGRAVRSSSILKKMIFWIN